MEIFREKRRWRRRVFSKPVLWLLTILAGFLMVASARVLFKALKAVESRKEAERQYQELENQKERLEARIQNLQSPTALEKEAKERFNVKAEGEEVIIIVEPKTPTSTQTAAMSSNKFLEFLKKLFK